MGNNRNNPQSTGRIVLPPWLVLLLVAAGLIFIWWNKSQSPIAKLPSSENSQSSLDESLRHIPSLETRAPTGNGDEQNEFNESESDTVTKSSKQLPDEHEPTLPDIASDPESNSRPVGSTDVSTNRDATPLGGIRQKPQSRGPPDRRKNDRSENVSEDNQPNAKSSKSDVSAYKVENQSIRDLNGRVVFKGTIDLKPTLDRIERGEANRHRNDGTTFQNREGRLPRKTNGYYKEYVHPTPNENGPGPQRIIIGREGEIWYTPDHYKTFKQIKVNK